jgi:RNAse (barnase) inhibitor barstar
LRRIELDAAQWKSKDELYSNLLSGLEAPAWHGKNLDALWETLTEGAHAVGAAALTNGVQPPFRVVLRNIDLGSDEVRAFIPDLEKLFAEANAQYRVNAQMILFIAHEEHNA